MYISYIHVNVSSQPAAGGGRRAAGGRRRAGGGRPVAAIWQIDSLRNTACFHCF